MRHFFQLKVILQNLEMVVAVAMGIISLVVDLIDDNDKTNEVVTNLTTLILVSLAIGIIRDRFIREQLRKKIEKLVPEFLDLEIRHKFIEEIRDLVNGSKECIVCQMRTGEVVDDLFDEFKLALLRGCKIKLIICKRSENIVKTLSLYSYRNHGTEGIMQKQAACRSAIFELWELNVGILEVNESEYLPSTLKYISDPDSMHGKAFIVPVTFQENSREAPSIKLNRKNKKDEFDHYVSEFNRFWKHSVSLKNTKD